MILSITGIFSPAFTSLRKLSFKLYTLLKEKVKCVCVWEEELMESSRITAVSTATPPGLGLLKCDGCWELLGMKPRCDRGSNRMTTERHKDKWCVTSSAVRCCRSLWQASATRPAHLYEIDVCNCMRGGSDAFRRPTGRTMVNFMTCSPTQWLH